MDSSANKRRKTSPNTSVPVESTTPPDPLPKQPPHQQGPRSSPSRSPQRPSFASPTRSSLARHNPGVIVRRRHAAPHRSDNIPASEPNRPEENADVDDALTAQFERHSEGDGVASSREASASASQRNITEAGSGAATRSSIVSRLPSRHIGGNTLGAQPARRTPTRPLPRPLPPPEAREEELLANPFDRRGLHMSPLSTGVLPAVVHEEPELPPTPEHPDPVVSTPPSGIHNTPSKRRRDQSEKDALRLQSSPSKRPPSQPAAGASALPQKESQKTRIMRSASPVKHIMRTLQSLEGPNENELSTLKSRGDFAAGTHPRRSVRLRGPNWEKQQERDALLKQVAQLEADLTTAKLANSHAVETLSLAEESNVLDLLRRHLAPMDKEKEHDSRTEWLDAAMDPIVMLGFNGLSAIHLPPAIPDETAERQPEPHIISHHPVPMNASEELPYLQMFTPLTFSSSVATISSPNGRDETNFQEHTINVRSANPSGLFAACIKMVINTNLHAVASLVVSRLDPAAAGELKPFLDQITSDQAHVHPVKARNVSLLCWAMGEWYRIAVQRAKFWTSLETSLDSKDALLELVRSTRIRRKKKNRRQEQAGGTVDGFDEIANTNLYGDPTPLTRARLLSHMGRTSMNLEIPYLKMEDETEAFELRVMWAVEFDWTGEARSKLGVMLSVPSRWQAIDKRKSLVGIPNMFEKLLQGGEAPLSAVKTVVALLAGDPEAYSL